MRNYNFLDIEQNQHCTRIEKNIYHKLQKTYYKIKWKSIFLKDME